jgi:NitT/TauT family transport system ATP-binding protein
MGKQVMAHIELKEVRKEFPSENGRPNVVISDLSLRLPHGSFTALVGANGCGKTTLLNLIAGIMKPDAGTVAIHTGEQRDAKVGYVWQDYRASLLPWRDVGENISFPLRLRGVRKSERLAIARKALAGFTTDIQIDNPVYSLSGGQQQLVCLLRSIVANPDVLLLDEPLSALDQSARWTMAFRIERAWMEHPMPALIVSHDVDEAVMLADRLIYISRSGGRIAASSENPLPRPRSVRMLTSAEHIRCREAVIEFLSQEGALRDRDSNSNSERKAAAR